MTEDDELQPDDEDVGLEPLGRYQGSRGISAAMKAVFDVLYESGEPLDIDTLADRTFDRVQPAVRYHAHRAYVRRAQRSRRPQGAGIPSAAKDTSTDSPTVSLRYAWRTHIGYLVPHSALRGVLVRDDGSYVPNPLKPPRVMQASGKTVLYTREAWAQLGDRDRTLGDVQVMRMELDRVLAGLDRQALRRVVKMAAQRFEGPATSDIHGTTLRARVRWLLDRPTTDEAKAWLLLELVRRCYGDPPVT